MYVCLELNSVYQVWWQVTLRIILPAPGNLVLALVGVFIL